MSWILVMVEDEYTVTLPSGDDVRCVVSRDPLLGIRITTVRGSCFIEGRLVMYCIERENLRGHGFPEVADAIDLHEAAKRIDKEYEQGNL